MLLRPLRTQDYEAIYRAEALSLERIVRHRHRGTFPPPEQYTASLWSNVLVNLIAADRETDQPVALYTCYGEQFQHGTAKLAALRLGADDRVSGLEGVEQFISYLFDVFPFRKLYSDVLAWNADQFASVLRFGATLEGRFVDHEMHGTTGVDLLVFAITREAWGRFISRTDERYSKQSGTLTRDEFRAEICQLLDLDFEHRQMDDRSFFEDLDSLEKIMALDFIEAGAEREVPVEMIASWTSIDDMFHAFTAIRGLP